MSITAWPSVEAGIACGDLRETDDHDILDLMVPVTTQGRQFYDQSTGEVFPGLVSRKWLEREIREGRKTF